jgi:uncharacterized membrane protein YuzA (DUF378 family)
LIFTIIFFVTNNNKEMFKITEQQKFYVNFAMRIIVLIGALNYLVITFGKQHMLSFVNSSVALQAFNVIVGLCGLYLAVHRDYYLPFLGPTVMPSFNTSKKPQQNVIDVDLTGLPANVDVVYWASKSATNVTPNPWDAYGDYSNSGVIKSDTNGSCTIQVECPGTYSVGKLGYNKELPKHIHYRYEYPSQRGMFSHVMTKQVNC